MKTLMHMIDTGGPGGAESVYYQIAEHFHAAGYASLVIVSRQGWLTSKLHTAGLHPRILNSKRLGRFRYLVSLMKIVLRHKPRLIICHLYGSSLFGAIIGLVTRIRVVGVFHGQSDVPISEKYRFVKRQLLRAGLYRVVFVSDALRDDVSVRLRIPECQSVVIPNGVDHKLLSAAQSGGFRSSLGIGPSSRLIGAVGNLRLTKDYSTLLRSVPHVLTACPDAHFVIAGDASQPLLDELKRLSDSLSISDRIHFLGHVSNVAGLLKDLDIFVTTSTTEGFSIACVEAMASGVPVVATRSGGPESILDSGACGILVDVGDVRGVAEGILKLLSDPSLRKKFVSAAKTRAEQLYSTDRMLNAYSEFIGK